MPSKTALRIILLISTGGLIFSGYLSYTEIFTVCTAECPPIEAPGGLVSLPACVYGFFLYAGIVAVALLGLRKAQNTKT